MVPQVGAPYKSNNLGHGIIEYSYVILTCLVTSPSRSYVSDVGVANPYEATLLGCNAVFIREKAYLLPEAIAYLRQTSRANLY